MLNNALHLYPSNLLNITMHYTLTTSTGAAGIPNQKFLLSQSNIYRKDLNDNLKKYKLPTWQKRGLDCSSRLSCSQICCDGERQIELDKSHV